MIENIDPVFCPFLTSNKFKYIQFAGCRADKQDRGNCQYWKNTGYCHRSSKYYAYMQDHCYATCTNCKGKYKKLISKSCSF